MNVDTGKQAFTIKLAKITCQKCGTDFTVDTIMLSVFWDGNYYCQDCGKDIIEGWKVGQTY
jgi:DNA-directed RNA polymerase subunit RPC12/RpoP